MSRQDYELELVVFKFEYYTQNFRQCIHRVIASLKCKDTDNAVIDSLWTDCRTQVASLLFDMRGSSYQSYKAKNRKLDPEEREIIRNYIDQARSYEAELGDLEDHELESIYRTVFDPIIRVQRDQRARSAREADRWAFFNKADAAADFERWRDRLLTPEQAVALSFGKDPNIVTVERLTPYQRSGRSHFAEAFKDRLDMVKAAIASGKLYVPMSVSAFTHWATGQGLVPPPGLMGEAAEAIEEDAAFWKKKYEILLSEMESLRGSIDELSPKAKMSIYRLIVGMAAARFEYRTDQRTKATTAIQRGLADVGISLGSEAILEHLTVAASALDFSWKSPISWSGVKRPEK